MHGGWGASGWGARRVGRERVGGAAGARMLRYSAWSQEAAFRSQLDSAKVGERPGKENGVGRDNVGRESGSRGNVGRESAGRESAGMERVGSEANGAATDVSVRAGVVPSPTAAKAAAPRP